LFVLNDTTRKQVRETYNIAPSTKVILYIARLVDAKLPFVFAQVMKELAAKNYDFAAFVIGGGYLEQPLKDFLFNAGLSSKVHMLGSLGNDKVRNVMSVGDIVFLPTEIEGISLSLMEGMAMGLVPISVDVGGQSELVDAKSGFLIKLEPDRTSIY
jgi:glycosyltransferase involved in cell wall biosynthesis